MWNSYVVPITKDKYIGITFSFYSQCQMNSTLTLKRKDTLLTGSFYRSHTSPKENNDNLNNFYYFNLSHITQGLLRYQ